MFESNASLSCLLYFRSVDEILVSYICGILEDFDEAFDVELFYEMMGAYIPEFTEILKDKVQHWLQHLSCQLKHVKQGERTKSM